MGIKYLYRIKYNTGDYLEHHNLLYLSAYMSDFNKKNNINHTISVNSLKNIVLNRNKPNYIDTIEKHNFKEYYKIPPNDRRTINKIYNKLYFQDKIVGGDKL
jgi:hypothetical protein